MRSFTQFHASHTCSRCHDGRREKKTPVTRGRPPSRPTTKYRLRRIAAGGRARRLALCLAAARAGAARGRAARRAAGRDADRAVPAGRGDARAIGQLLVVVKRRDPYVTHHRYRCGSRRTRRRPCGRSSSRAAATCGGPWRPRGNDAARGRSGGVSCGTPIRSRSRGDWQHSM